MLLVWFGIEYVGHARWLLSKIGGLCLHGLLAE